MKDRLHIKTGAVDRSATVIDALRKSVPSSGRSTLAVFAVILATVIGAPAQAASPMPEAAAEQTLLKQTTLSPLCVTSDKRPCEILSLIAATHPVRKILWSNGTTSHPSVAAEYEWAIGDADVIHLGDTRDLDDDALFFLIAHEVAHSMLGHGRKLVEFFAGPQGPLLSDLEIVKRFGGQAMRDMHLASELKHRQEFEADAFAARIMTAKGMNPSTAMRKVLRNAHASATHPSRRERLSRVESIVAADAGERRLTAGLIPGR